MIIYYLIEYPLFLIYQNCPSIFGVGGWGGFSDEQICSRLTSQPERYWEINSSDCVLLVNSRFQSFFITVQVAAYFILLFSMINVLLQLFMKKLGDKLVGNDGIDKNHNRYLIIQS